MGSRLLNEDGLVEDNTTTEGNVLQISVEIINKTSKNTKISCEHRAPGSSALRCKDKITVS